LASADAEGFVGLGDAYMALGKDRAALAAYDRALRLDPRHARAHYHESLTLLAQGSFLRGWQGFGWRWRAEPPRRSLGETGLPPWQGRAARNARLLLQDEGVAVEDIVFSQCLGDLLALGPEVTFRGDAGLAALLRRAFPGIALLEEGAALPPVDAAITLGSLPGFFRRKKPEFRRPAGHLVADLRATTAWRTRYRGRGPGRAILGIAATGEILWPARRGAVLPHAMIAALAALPGLCLVGLEPQEIEDAPESGADPAIGHWPDPADDLDALASRIAATDLVVAMPGRSAALAAALGKPVFLVAPQPAGWLWGLRGASVPWFPNLSALRLRPEGDAEKDATRLAAAVAAHLAGSSAGT